VAGAVLGDPIMSNRDEQYEDFSHDDTPFGMIEYCLTVTLSQLLNEHVLCLHGLSAALFELANDAPLESASRIRALPVGASEQCDDLDGLLEMICAARC
jgi:hypothetical protein